MSHNIFSDDLNNMDNNDNQMQIQSTILTNELISDDEVDKNILKIVSDPSDAVLVACGILTKSDIITRDKHHLFTVELENFLKRYNIRVLNNFHSL